MGKNILEVVQNTPWKEKFEVVAEINSKTKAETLPAKIDVVVDFSGAASTLHWLNYIAEKKIPYLICTTGFKAEEFSQIKTKLDKQAWAFIPNTSLGIFAFIRCLCGLVKFFSDTRSIEIHEVHHTQKKDSPSGTALLIKAALTEALLGTAHGKNLEIAVHSAREGDVVGIHSVIIQRKFDRLILTHEAQDRKLFAEGALMLAEKLSLKAAREKPYTFEELL